jgi:hypothetical protein
MKPALLPFSHAFRVLAAVMTESLARIPPIVSSCCDAGLVEMVLVLENANAATKA